MIYIIFTYCECQHGLVQILAIHETHYCHGCFAWPVGQVRSTVHYCSQLHNLRIALLFIYHFANLEIQSKVGLKARRTACSLCCCVWGLEWLLKLRRCCCCCFTNKVLYRCWHIRVFCCYTRQSEFHRQEDDAELSAKMVTRRSEVLELVFPFFPTLNHRTWSARRKKKKSIRLCRDRYKHWTWYLALMVITFMLQVVGGAVKGNETISSSRWNVRRLSAAARGRLCAFTYYSLFLFSLTLSDAMHSNFPTLYCKWSPPISTDSFRRFLCPLS